MQAQIGAYGNDRTTGVVHALAQQVLPEAPLLAFEGVAQGLQGTLVGAGDHAAVAPVVEEHIHGFLQHALLVAHDDVRSAQINESFQPVVAVDHAPVEIVEIRGGEPPAFQGHQGAQIRRQHGDHVHDHPRGVDTRFAEGIHDFQPLGQFLALGGRPGFANLLAQLLVQLIQIDLLQQALDGFGPDAGVKLVAVSLQRFPVFLLGQHLPAHQRRLLGFHHDVAVEIQHLLHVLESQVEQVADLAREALEEPDMRDRGSQFDVRHALAAHLGLDHLHTAFLADDAAVLHALVFAAVAFVILGGPEDLGAEQAVALRFERSVVDGFRLFDLAIGPLANLLGSGQGDADAGIASRIRGFGKKVV